MPGLVPGIHVFLFAEEKTWMAGTSPAMTKEDVALRLSSECVTVAGVTFTADLAGALFWDEERLLIVSDLHLEKGSSFAQRGVLLPPSQFETWFVSAAHTEDDIDHVVQAAHQVLRETGAGGWR